MTGALPGRVRCNTQQFLGKPVCNDPPNTLTLRVVRILFVGLSSKDPTLRYILHAGPSEEAQLTASTAARARHFV